MIHPSAIVSEQARIGAGARIGPYAVVEADVEIGEGATIDAHAFIRDGARIGKSVSVGSFSTIAGAPQDFSFDPARRTYVEIGDGAIIRENVTISRATKDGAATRIGRGCMLMASSHVGHDCVVGDKVVMANGALLAGHVHVGEFTVFGGLAAVHQFCRIGTGVMYGGMSPASLDVAPYTVFAERNTLFGLNLVGLRRRGHSREAIDALRECYRIVFLETGSLRATAASLLSEERFGGLDETRRFLEFFAEGKRGFARPGRGG